jgi:hypothetical protein
MDTTAMLLWGLLFGSIGLGYFIYGKKQANGVVRYTGIALMVFPYFVPDPTALVVIGIALLAIPRFVKL